MDYDKGVEDELAKPFKKIKHFHALIPILGLVLGIFFLSFNSTGSVIGLNQNTSNWIGIILFILGIISAFWYIKSR